MKADPQGGERLDWGGWESGTGPGDGKGRQEGGAAGAGQQIRPPEAAAPAGWVRARHEAWPLGYERFVM